MANYAIMRIEKRKLGAVGRICRHNERLKKEYKSNPDIDLERTRENYHIIGPCTNYRKEVLQKIEEAGARMRKDSVVLQDCFIGATPEWIHGKLPEKQREYFEYAVRFFEDTFGRKNIISAVVHMDEATPHMHLSFVPLTKDGRLSSKELIGGPKGLSQLQEAFYVHMSKRYPDLSRGISARVTQRQHIPVYMYKNADMLYAHYQELKEAVSEINSLSLMNNRIEAIDLLQKYAPELAKLKEQSNVISDKIEYLERSIWNERNGVGNYGEDKKEKKKIIREKNRELYELNEKQKKLEKLISAIPYELFEHIRQKELIARRIGGWER